LTSALSLPEKTTMDKLRERCQGDRHNQVLSQQRHSHGVICSNKRVHRLACRVRIRKVPFSGKANTDAYIRSWDTHSGKLSVTAYQTHHGLLQAIKLLNRVSYSIQRHRLADIYTHPLKPYNGNPARD